MKTMSAGPSQMKTNQQIRQKTLDFRQLGGLKISFLK